MQITRVFEPTADEEDLLVALQELLNSTSSRVQLGSTTQSSMETAPPCISKPVE
jgi:hypothetical protein